MGVEVVEEEDGGIGGEVQGGEGDVEEVVGEEGGGEGS